MPTDPNATESGADLDYLDAHAIRIEPAPAGFVRLHLPDRCYPRAIAVWAFPFTDRRHWIAFRDPEDNPLGMIRDSHDLDRDSRAHLTSALNRRYFIPRISRIREAREEFGLLIMSAQTDRGDITFTVNNPRENIHWIGPSRILFIDAEENRYEVMDYDTLDARSQSLLGNVI
ncbi:MAG TPA: DUF1854 domain-containing protein [Armatimonadota bacterium]